MEAYPQRYFLIVGTLILSFGSAVFILPFDLITGGMSGLAIVIDSLAPIEFITVDELNDVRPCRQMMLPPAMMLLRK